MKVALLLLGCLLLVQVAHLMPVVDPSSSSSEEDTPRAIFQKETFKQIREFYLYILIGISRIFGNIILKAKHETNPGEELNKYLSEFSKFIEDVEQSSSTEENIPKLQVLLDMMVGISKRYIAAAKDHPEQIPDHLSIYTNGFDLFRPEMRNKLKEFETSFTKTVDDYASGLTDAEAKKEETLINWFNKYKSAAYTSQKYMSFIEIFSELS